jgi:hypothetical protein
MVTFETASLLDPRAQTWGRMDVIFCRNVLIYFDDAAKRKVLESLWEGLLPGGYLVLGPSDSLFGITDAFQRTPHSAYNFFQRPADSAGPRVAVSHEREKTPAPNTDTGPTTPSADDEAAAATPGAAPVIGDALRFKLLITRLDAGLRDLGRDVTNSVDRSVEAVTAVEELLSRSKDRDEETLRQLRLEVASARRQLARMLVYLQVADRSEQKLEALRALLQELSDRLLGTAAEAPDLGVRTTSFDPAMLRSGEQDDDADDSEAMSQDDIDTLFD